MRRQYFKDSDTLLFEFGDTYIDGPIDHVDLDYQTSIEFDCEGNLVALTIEHAKERGALREGADESASASTAAAG